MTNLVYKLNFFLHSDLNTATFLGGDNDCCRRCDVNSFSFIYLLYIYLILFTHHLTGVALQRMALRNLSYWVLSQSCHDRMIGGYIGKSIICFFSNRNPVDDHIQYFVSLAGDNIKCLVCPGIGLKLFRPEVPPPIPVVALIVLIDLVKLKVPSP